jgi:protein gp37
MGDTSIEWTDKTWNPVRGCSRVSEGCRNCYAERVAARFSGPGQPYEGLATMTAAGPRWTGKTKPIYDQLDAPFHWRKPQRIFVNSMSDLFHESVSEDFIRAVWTTMAQAPRHTYQILTKRPERMARIVSGFVDDRTTWREGWTGIALPNVWLGVSVEDQKTADERIPHLLATPAAVRFLSAEPLLGFVDFTRYTQRCEVCGETPNDVTSGQSWRWDGRTWQHHHGYPYGHAGAEQTGAISLVIAGGESGPGARPMHPHWPLWLRDQCQTAGIAFFFKQWGAWRQRSFDGLLQRDLDRGRVRILSREGRQHTGFGYGDAVVERVGKKAAGRLLDGREWNEMPKARAMEATQ